MKLKECSVCKNKTYLFKSNPPVCKYCYRGNTPIKKVSSAMKDTLTEYRPLRLEYLNSHPICELKLSGCTREATCIHHKQGKSSKQLYLDTTKWLASCYSCNLNVELIGEEAYTKNLKIRRNESS
jgi:hypothetical protein